MKKHILPYIAALCLLCFTSLSYAQTNPKQGFTEGKIIYKIDVISDNDQVKQMFENSTMTLYVKGTQTCGQMNMGAMIMSVVGDNATKKGMMLMDMMGMKKAITMSEDDYKEYQKKAKTDYKVEYKDDTKTIAGYVCKKAIIKTDDGNQMSLWYTEDIKVNSFGGGQYDKVKGFPMEYQVSQQGINMTFTVTDIQNTKVDDAVFAIPTGYDQMTLKEFMASMGQGAPAQGDK